MKNTLYEGYKESRISMDMATDRIRRIIRDELTDRQREVLVAYYFQGKRIPQISEELGIHKSSVSRTLRRAEEILKNYMKY